MADAIGPRRNLRAEMARAGITCVDVAQAVGVAEGTVRKWVRGDSSPSVVQAAQVAAALGGGFSVEYLFIEG